MEKKRKPNTEKIIGKKNMASKKIRREKQIRFDRWSNLPNDILETIMKRLFYVDLINLGAVCKSWNSIKRITVFTPLKQLFPWRVIFNETSISNTRTSSCTLIDPNNNKTYTFDTSNIDNLFIGNVYESKNGWLLVSSYIIYYSLFAYTPFSSVNNFIELPTFDESRRIHIEFATFTTNPSMDKDCLFIVLHDHEHSKTSNDDSTIKISICRRGEKSWSTRYLKYVSLLVYNLYNEVINWIYSEGVICMVQTIGYSYGDGLRRRLVGIVKWEVMEISHGDQVLYSSFMKFEKDDDDSNYWLSKILRKDFSHVNHGYGSWLSVEGGRRRMLEIDPPSHY